MEIDARRSHAHNVTCIVTRVRLGLNVCVWLCVCDSVYMYIDINNWAQKIPKTEKEEVANRRDNSSTLMEYALSKREILCDVRFLLLFLFGFFFLMCCSGDAECWWWWCRGDVSFMPMTSPRIFYARFSFLLLLFFLFRALYFISFL